MLSAHEPTWDPVKKCHTCCGSKHSYHLAGCPKRTPKIPGRASDPDFVKVQNLKAQGLTSGQVARKLGMALDQVNDLWLI